MFGHSNPPDAPSNDNPKQSFEKALREAWEQANQVMEIESTWLSETSIRNDSDNFYEMTNQQMSDAQAALSFSGAVTVLNNNDNRASLEDDRQILAGIATHGLVFSHDRASYFYPEALWRGDTENYKMIIPGQYPDGTPYPDRIRIEGKEVRLEHDNEHQRLPPALDDLALRYGPYYAVFADFQIDPIVAAALSRQGTKQDYLDVSKFYSARLTGIEDRADYSFKHYPETSIERLAQGNSVLVHHPEELLRINKILGNPMDTAPFFNSSMSTTDAIRHFKKAHHGLDTVSSDVLNTHEWELNLFQKVSNEGSDIAADRLYQYACSEECQTLTPPERSKRLQEAAASLIENEKIKQWERERRVIANTRGGMAFHKVRVGIDHIEEIEINTSTEAYFKGLKKIASFESGFYKTATQRFFKTKEDIENKFEMLTQHKDSRNIGLDLLEKIEKNKIRLELESQINEATYQANTEYTNKVSRLMYEAERVIHFCTTAIIRHKTILQNKIDEIDELQLMRFETPFTAEQEASLSVYIANSNAWAQSYWQENIQPMEKKIRQITQTLVEACNIEKTRAQEELNEKGRTLGILAMEKIEGIDQMIHEMRYSRPGL